MKEQKLMGLIKFSRQVSILSALCLSQFCFAQDYGRQPADTVRFRSLDSILITADQRSSRLLPLPAGKGTYFYEGKKTESIRLDFIDANRVNNNPRQLFAKVPGVFVYENDGAGNQVNISPLVYISSWMIVEDGYDFIPPTVRQLVVTAHPGQFLFGLP